MDKKIDVMWDDNPIDITAEANFIWSIANKLRGVYMPDKYGDVIIPMTIIRRFECALERTKKAVVEKYKENPQYPYKAMCKLSGYQFYNTSEFSLGELCNDPDHVEDNFVSYLEGFSSNVLEILNDDETLKFYSHIRTMSKGGCLYSVIKAFSELDLYPETYDSIKMGYIFENLIGRFFQNVDQGQYYTGRDIIKVCVSLLIAEGCDDIFDPEKTITVCDQACGTGGMLSTAFSYLKHYNPSANVRLFGQEFNGVSYSVGLAEMLIKGQNAENFKHADTFKEDCFPGTKMRFLIENPPFGTPWAGEHAKAGQELAVKNEYEKGAAGRWGAGLPGGGDSQFIFMQSAINKMDDENGRAAIISNNSPLYAGGTASGESQIRKWLLENDLIEAIVQMPTDLFYNTGLSTYVWILSKNKAEKRKGKIQIIDASSICHKLWKPVGDKKNEFTASDRAAITRLYADFEENEHSKILDNSEFIYREYTVMQPLQRSYGFSQERIETMIQAGTLKSLWDEDKVSDLEAKGTTATVKEQKMLASFYETRSLYEEIIRRLQDGITDKIWKHPDDFMPELAKILYGVELSSKLLDKIADGLSVMDKTAIIQKDKKGNIIYDKATKETEIIKLSESVEEYLDREIRPYIPDAELFFEENLALKNPVIKTGAEIPFKKYFYKFTELRSAEELFKDCMESFEASKALMRSFISNEESSVQVDEAELDDTGFEWLGRLPKHWSISKIAAEYGLRNTKVSDSDYEPLSVTMNGIVPQLDSAAKTNAHDDRKLVKKGDFAINSRSDRRGACGISDRDGSVSLINTVLSPKGDMNPEYYDWLFHTEQFADEFYRNGHGIVDDLWTTGWQEMKRIPIPVPPTDEQEKIVDNISVLEQLIENQKRQLELLEEYKQVLSYEYTTGKRRQGR